MLTQRFSLTVGTATVVATGGGPGAMEAANLGGRLAGHDVATLDEALAELAAVPSFRPDIDAWVRSTLAVDVPDPHDSLGIPTWHYGHEPPNVFATAIAKYFRNAQREAILLHICDGGIVFLPGAAGTIQEVFQDACENYYADESRVTPMILVGHEFWTQTLPVWPLLQTLARGRAMESYVHLVEGVDDAVALLADGPRGSLTLRHDLLLRACPVRPAPGKAGRESSEGTRERATQLGANRRLRRNELPRD